VKRVNTNNVRLYTGTATMTTESSKTGAKTLSRTNFSRYIGHVTIFLLLHAVQ